MPVAFLGCLKSVPIIVPCQASAHYHHTQCFHEFLPASRQAPGPLTTGQNVFESLPAAFVSLCAGEWQLALLLFDLMLHTSAAKDTLVFNVAMHAAFLQL